MRAGQARGVHRGPASSDGAANIAKLSMVPRHILIEIPRPRHSGSRYD